MTTTTRAASGTTTYAAVCVRVGDWWAITVPDVPAVHTQARRLDQVEQMAQEAVSIVLGVPERSISITVMPEIPGDLAAEVDAAKELRETAERYQREATAAVRAVAERLVERCHLTLRDAGRILGISHQRVAQLLERVGGTASMGLDPAQHNAYLSAVTSGVEPLRVAMVTMALAARAAGDALVAGGFSPTALHKVDGVGAAMADVRDRAAAYLDRLAASDPPEYMRGADGQLQDALKLLVHAALRGIAGSTARDADRIVSAASEMNIANRDIERVAAQIANWQTEAVGPAT